jgi:putative YphP/YqiW family bacilliredoxin
MQQHNFQGADMYPDAMVAPMREELTRLGIEELRTADEVDRVLDSQPGTTMVVVNSICGCAAGRMRPAVRLALENANLPDRMVTVFAGQDREATERARSYFIGYGPSSPCVALLRNAKLVYMMQRSDIENRDAGAIANDLKAAFNRFCAKSGAATPEKMRQAESREKA